MYIIGHILSEYLLHEHTLDVYRFLTKREVKMAGYWPSSFFCLFMDPDFVCTLLLSLEEFALQLHNALL